MTNLSINLLPQEAVEQVTAARKFQLVRNISLTVFLMAIFLASTVVALRILQSRTLGDIKVAAVEQEQKVAALKDTESGVVLVKNRLDLYNALKATGSKPREIY